MSNRPNSRSKGGIHTPIQRSGSKLEVLPPEVQAIINSEVSPRQTHSAGSDGRGSCNERPGTPPFQRSSSEGRLTPNQDPLIRKQVVLPTVKRDYERYGVSKIEPHDKTMGDPAVLGNHDNVERLNSSADKTDNRLDDAQGAVGGVQRSKVETEMEILISKLKVNEKSRLKESKTVSQKEGDRAKGTTPDINNSSEDSYYLSHTPSVQPSMESFPSCTTSDSSIGLQIAPSGASGEEGTGAKEEEEESSSEGEEEEEKAPFELLGEFLESVMDEDYENADKLCKMILLYEPENAECKQFQPLIEEMLKREREEQLWGSDDDSDDNSDADDDDSDNDEGESDDEETESSSDESSDESSSDSEGEEGQR